MPAGRAYGTAMRIRTRKFIGIIATVGFMIVYCLLAMLLGNAVVLRYGTFGETVFFALAGLAWLPPAMLLVRWMQRPDEE